MLNLKEALMLTDQGFKDLKKAIFACTLTNFSLMLPFAISIQIFSEVLKPLMGAQIEWSKLWLYYFVGIIGALVVFIAHKNDYKKTYVASYMESEATRIRVAEHIRKLPMSFFNSKDLSELTTNIMGDCATTEHVLSHIIPQIIANAISITFICISLALFDWRLSLTMFSTLPLSFLIIWASRKIQLRMSENHVEAKLKASEQVQEYIEGIKVIKACGLDGAKFSKLNEALKEMMKMAIKLEFVAGVLITGAQMVLQAGLGLTVFYGTYLITHGEVQLSTLLLFLLIVVKIYGPILTELTLLPELLYMQVSTARMRLLFSTSIMSGKTDEALPSLEIQLENVSFCYSGKHNSEEAAVKNFTAHIPANSITALVGPSGSGKSTIAKLIARFWDVNSGSIKIGGVETRDLDPEYLMSFMSFVFQDVILFSDSIFNNIKIGNMNASDEEVMAAAKDACCDEFIDRLPEGYETIIGENGGTLSGGERQRISIARALLKNAPIVLLDEATASLDPENEVYIQQAISRLIEGKTVIVIAHRLRTIEAADQIIVMEHGEAVAYGTHETLISQHGLYSKLYNLQKESLGWSV